METKNYFNLQNQVAIITGASSGIGQMAARAYAYYGCKLLILDKNFEKLEEFSTELKKDGINVLALQCDITDEENVKNVIQKGYEYFGKFDILLNCAGIATAGSVEDLDIEQWNLTFNVNVRGAYLLSKYVVPHMKEQKYGRIIQIGSVNSIVADKNPPFIRHSYNASKAAINGLSLGMACSLAQFGITVNTIAPGLFKTGMTENTLFKSEAFLNAYNYMNPMGRPATIDEIASTIIYLSSPSSSYVTGQVIRIDGGGSLV